MRKVAERISRRFRGVDYNTTDATGKFGLFYEECGTLPKLRAK